MQECSFNDEGTPESVFGVFMDLSELRETEQALKREMVFTDN